MTQDEIAHILKVNKSTVSRALSGKGRISDATKKRIFDLCSANNCAVSNVTESTSYTNSLAVVFPQDVSAAINLFFTEALLGIQEAAFQNHYNVLFTVENSRLKHELINVIENHLIDGVILTRGIEHDAALNYLLDKKIPVSLTGWCDSKEVITVDSDHAQSTMSLISELVLRGYRRFALVIGSRSYYVNRDRYEGFINAILKNGLNKNQQLILPTSLETEQLNHTVRTLIAQKTECVICGDDTYCMLLMSHLQSEGFKIPRDIAIASLYNGPALSYMQPPVTAVEISARKQGYLAADLLIRKLKKQPYESNTELPFNIIHRKSTFRPQDYMFE